MQPKPFYTSKTFWVNVFGLAYILFGQKLGIDFGDVQTQGSILAVLNIILRFVTKSPVSIS